MLHQFQAPAGPPANTEGWVVTLTIDDVFVAICEEIVGLDFSQEQWAQAESCDMFQQGNYCGGFDATEGEFVFEVLIEGNEYWFQFSLAEAAQIAVGAELRLQASLAS